MVTNVTLLICFLFLCLIFQSGGRSTINPSITKKHRLYYFNLLWVILTIALTPLKLPPHSSCGIKASIS